MPAWVFDLWVFVILVGISRGVCLKEVGKHMMLPYVVLSIVATCSWNGGLCEEFGGLGHLGSVFPTEWYSGALATLCD